MMSKTLKILRKSRVEALRKNVGKNIFLYQSVEQPGWDALLGAEEHLLPTKVEICGDINACFSRDDLTPKSGETEKDVLKRIRDNEADYCISVYNALGNLTPQQAADERLWVYLTHYVFWEYSRIRWPGNDDNRERKVSKHFFANDSRAIVRDNAISRLWWMGYVCNNVEGFSQKDALDALLSQQDVRKEIMERASFFQSRNILNTLMKFMVASYKGEKELLSRDNFRLLAKHLNRIGGVIVLDGMDTSELEKVIGQIIADDIGISPELP